MFSIGFYKDALNGVIHHTWSVKIGDLGSIYRYPM